MGGREGRTCVKTEAWCSGTVTPFPGMLAVNQRNLPNTKGQRDDMVLLAAPLKGKAIQKPVHFNGILGPTPNPGLIIVAQMPPTPSAEGTNEGRLSKPCGWATGFSAALAPGGTSLPSEARSPRPRHHCGQVPALSKSQTQGLFLQLRSQTGTVRPWKAVSVLGTPC